MGALSLVLNGRVVKNNNINLLPLLSMLMVFYKMLGTFGVHFFQKEQNFPTLVTDFNEIQYIVQFGWFMLCQYFHGNLQVFQYTNAFIFEKVVQCLVIISVIPANNTHKRCNPDKNLPTFCIDPTVFCKLCTHVSLLSFCMVYDHSIVRLNDLLEVKY